ncbi:amino acid/amide ABC transporter membrane protein 2 (HAAT family) [Varunaivibrio sulfuroxidans]|uniref:Amino acid/amide ABC transporter membrane protein 2 (HAAT family) n=2 Tax=Varunaivibrio sulfuroxidans TaxID=1773489 RepID=A0A4R3J9L7_9PROT|nr:amino acid/amide ABC transporter membrane protein 2 (HAAT family) [Varunaivibrio sulfuroxidans]
MNKTYPSFWRANAPVAYFAVIVLTMPFWFPLIGGYPGLDTKILIWAIFAIGFDILLGYMGYLSFGHAAFFGISAYTTGLMLLHYSSEIVPAMLMSVVVTTVAALIIGMLTLRRSGIYFSILTLAFGEMFYSSAVSTLQSWTGGDNGLTGLPTPTLFGSVIKDTDVFYLTAFFAIVAYFTARRIASSPFGLMLRAIKSNQDRLEFTGINVQRYKISGFVVSAIFAAFAGSLMVIYEPYVATEFLHWSTSGKIVIMSVIGGVGTLFGPMIGAAFMLYFENVISVALHEQWLLVLGLIFMAIVIFLPGGFVDGARRVHRKIMGRSAPSGPPAEKGEA